MRTTWAFRCKLREAAEDEIGERVEQAATILGLEPLLERYPRQLSGGQRQRVAMGRAIVRDPQVFLFDEPLSNLDAKLRVQMRTEIKELHQRLKTTTVYVTHDQIEAMTMADRIVVMQRRRHRADRRAARPLRPAGQPVRRRFHRLAGHEHAQREGLAGGEFRHRERHRAAACRKGVRDGQGGLRHPAGAYSPAARRRHGREVLMVEPTGSETQVPHRLGKARRGLRVARTGQCLHPGEAIRIMPDRTWCMSSTPKPATGLR